MRELGYKEIQSTLDGIADAIVILDRKWHLEWYNHAFLQIVDITEIEKSGHNFIKISQKVEGLNIADLISTDDESGKRQELVIHLSRSQKWYSLDVYCQESYITIVFHDITHSKQSHDSVLIDEQNLRILMDIIDQPVWLVDRDCRILLCNEAFKKWISYFLGSSLSKGDNLLDPQLSEVYLNKFKMCYELALSGKTFSTVEDMIVGGEMKFSTISFNPVLDKDGILTGISCRASDITDQRKSLTHLDAQTQLLMEIANIQSHKVRGPVATLLGLVKVFDYEDPTNPDNKEVVHGIASVTESLDEIVRDVIRNINKLNKRTKKMR